MSIVFQSAHTSFAEVTTSVNTPTVPMLPTGHNGTCMIAAGVIAGMNVLQSGDTLDP